MEPNIRTLLSVVLAACSEDLLAGTARLEVAVDEECPAAADVDPGSLTPFDPCTGVVVSVDGEAERVSHQCDLFLDEPKEECEYPVSVSGVDPDNGCGICGRPFELAGDLRTAPIVGHGRWAEAPIPAVSQLAPSVRADLAGAWAAIGAAEHASVASFARFTLELLAVGAPPELVAAAQQAGVDEVRHARLAFGLASAFAGRRLGPGPLSMDGLAVRPDLVALAVATAREGCLGETLSALEMAVARDRATDLAVRAVLDVVAADEARHAALAWRTLRWASAVDDRVGEAVAAVLRTPPAITGGTGDGHPAFGVLGSAERADVWARGWRDVVLPAATALG